MTLFVRLNCLLCCGAAAASYAAFLPQSAPLTTALTARVGPLTMHMYEQPEPRNWAQGNGARGEHSAAYRRARRARIFAEHQSTFAERHHAQPQSSAPHPHASESSSMSHGVAPMAPQGLEPTRVVLVFDAGLPNEGAYTQMEPDGSHNIFAFEDPADAYHFGQLLVAKGFDMPTAQHWPRSRMRIFLGENKDLGVTVVPRGTTPDAPSKKADDNKLAREDRDRTDQYTSHRLWLDQLMGMHVDNCGDDDCILG